MALVTASPALPAQRATVTTLHSVRTGVIQDRMKLTLRGRRLVALLALLPIVATFWLLGTRVAQAQMTGPTTAVVKVEAGQNLWDVAVAIAPNEDPRSTIFTIRALNGLETSEVQAGQALLVPVS